MVRAWRLQEEPIAHTKLPCYTQVHNRPMLVFTGDNRLTSDGLVAVSTDLLVSIINSHGTRLRLVVLNSCMTFDAAIGWG